jgi:hypothetical protein
MEEKDRNTQTKGDRMVDRKIKISRGMDERQRRS